jgi:hypothetical protein
MNQNGTNTVVFEPTMDGSNINFTTSHQLNNTTWVTYTGSDMKNSFNPEVVGSNNFTTGPSVFEVMNRMKALNGTDDGGFCSTLVVAGWIRVNPVTSTETAGRSAPTFGGTFNSKFIGCKPQLTVGTFDAYVDLEGHILRATRTGNLSQLLAQNSLNTSIDNFILDTNNQIFPAQGGYTGLVWHNDSFTSDWVNSLLGYTIHSDSFVNLLSPLPDSQNATALLQGVYKQLFALLLSLDTNVLSNASEPVPITLAVNFLEPRLFISPPMFKITIVLLALQLIVAVLYYVYRPIPFLPRIPTSIASIVSYISANHALDDFSPSDTKEKGGGGRYKIWL